MSFSYNQQKGAHAPLIVEYAGGMGNQFFQYALGHYLHERTKRPLFFDATAVQRDEKRSLTITQFGIDQSNIIFSRAQLFAMLGDRIKTSLSTREKIVHVIFPYHEPGTSSRYLLVDDDILAPSFIAHHTDCRIEDYVESIVTQIQQDPQKPVYVRGYWQYAFFAEHVSSFLRARIRFETPSYLQDHSIITTRENTCSIHVRRGDYLDSEVQSVFAKIDNSYYKNATKKILDQHPDTGFFVFSDDAQWCKDHLDIGADFDIVSGSDSKSDVDDLFLMNACTHHILANSSFSWWGATLSLMTSHTAIRPLITPMVIAPHKWFTTQHTSWIFARSWVLV